MKSIQQYIFLGIALLLLGSSYWLDITDRKAANLEKYARQVQNYLELNEASVLEIFEDEDKIKRFIAKDYDDNTWKDIQDLTKEKYSFFIYEKDSLLFWSTNTVIPAIEEIRATSVRQFKIIYLNDSRFELVKQPIIIDNHKYILCGLIPIYYEYDIKNEHIENHFALKAGIPKKVFISDTPKDQVVLNPRGEEIFYLTALDKFTDYTMRVILLLMYGFGFLFLGAFINRVSIGLSRQRSPIIGFGFLILSVFLVRFFSLSVSDNTVFSDIPLFEAQELVAPVVSGSMSLFINIILLLWVVIFFYREVPIKDPSKYQIFRQYFLVFASYGMVFMAIIWINRIVQNLVSLARVTFDYDNVFELNEYSFIGLISISILVILLFFFSHKIIPSVNKANIPREHKLAFGGIVLAVSLLGAILGITNWGLFYIVGFSFGYIALFEFFTKDNVASFQWLGGFIFIYSFFITGLLVYHNVQREQQQRVVFADRLVTKRDLATEEAFINIENKLLDANIVKNLKNPLIPKLSILAAITNINKKQKYLNSEYEFGVFFYDVNGKKIRGETRPFGEFEEMVANADSTLSPNLYFSKSEVGYSYIAKLTILNNSRVLGSIIIHYEPKSAVDLDVYPELLEDRSLAKNTGVNYDYAVYNDGKLVKDKGGVFEDKLTYDTPEKNGRRYLVNKNGYSHLIYRADNNQVVIVSKELNEVMQYLSLFSYVFIFLLLVLLILVLLRRTTNIFPQSITDTFTPKPSLHNSIQTSILAIIVLTFLTIGMVTFFYFRSDTEEYHASRLSRKGRGVISSSNYWLKVNAKDSTYILDIKELAKIHRLDVNLFDNNGRLIKASQEEIFKTGLIGRQMPPLPYYEMTQKGLKEFTESERIGTLEYRAAYLAVRNSKGENVGFLGLPYYSERGDFNEDIADFTGVLLNVYVLLLVVAFIAAFVTASSITQPLAVLKDKLRDVQLGKKNEKVVWDTKDEIGVLIDEFNKMLAELEVSANKLATSEREGAWREMAKQVAHEIKNPLTPMKLSIQYLVRAYQMRPDEIGPMMKRVSATLIEQIDSLARIATEFSNFAKMPTAENEYLSINHLVKSVYNLFSENDDVDTKLDMAEEDFQVFGDKEQLMRVLNNVIKNAIQAVPDDRKGRISVSLEKYVGKNIQIRVVDNGCGIPEDKRHAVFVPNFTTKNSGTGLGLAISRKIIEQAGGQIYFESVEDEGTTFFIELPIAERKEEE
jgi:two-component system nitrogen regulation sensor histidine kinase NtrY